MKLTQSPALTTNFDPQITSANILHRVRWVSPASTSRQIQVDGWVSGFVHQAIEWKSLAAMMVGGLAYRLGRAGVAGLGSGAFIRAASMGLGLASEVSAFELTSRRLTSFPAGAHGRAPLHANLWSWNGSGGLRQGLLNSLITFGTLKLGGRLAQGQNLILQHGVQDLAMVAGHQLVYGTGLGPKPEGSFAEQMMRAEATNLQLEAGLSLGHGLTGGRLKAFERELDLSSLIGEGGAQSLAPLQPLQAAFAMARSTRAEADWEFQPGVHRPKKSALLHVGAEKIQSLRVNANRFGRAMRRILKEKFNGEITLMTEHLGLSTADCDAYLRGLLPRDYETAERIALKLGGDPRPVTKAWLKDQMALLEATHPLSPKIGPAAVALTRLVRLTLLRQSKTGSVWDAADQDRVRMHRYSQAFRGDLPVSPPALRDLFRLIVDSGIVEESAARSAIGAYVEESIPDAKRMERPDQEYQENEFDHRHYDALEAGATLSLDSLTQKQELLILHLSEASPYPMTDDSPLTVLQKKEARKELSRLFTCMTPKETTVLQQRFGFFNEEARTLKEVAQGFHRSLQSIQTLQMNAIQKLKKMTRHLGLYPPPTDSVEATEPSWVQAQWHEKARAPYLIETFYNTLEREQRAKAQRIQHEIWCLRTLTEQLRHRNRGAFDLFLRAAERGEITHLGILRRFAEQKDPRRALPFVRVLTQILASRHATGKNYTRWFVDRLDTESLETAASQGSPGAYLGLKWLAEANNTAAREFLERAPIKFSFLQKKELSVPQTIGIYLLNSKGKGYLLPIHRDLLILSDPPPDHPLVRPSLLLFRPLTEGHLPLIREEEKISRAFLPEKNLEEGYRLSIGGEEWVLRYLPPRSRGPRKVKWG